MQRWAEEPGHPPPHHAAVGGVLHRTLAYICVVGVASRVKAGSRRATTNGMPHPRHLLVVATARPYGSRRLLNQAVDRLRALLRAATLLDRYQSRSTLGRAAARAANAARQHTMCTCIVQAERASASRRRQSHQVARQPAAHPSIGERAIGPRWCATIRRWIEILLSAGHEAAAPSFTDHLLMRVHAIVRVIIAVTKALVVAHACVRNTVSAEFQRDNPGF